MNTTKKIKRIEHHLSVAREGLQSVQQQLKQMKEDRKAADITLTNEQAARILGVSARTIIRMKNDGRLPDTNFLTIIKKSQR